MRATVPVRAARRGPAAQWTGRRRLEGVNTLLGSLPARRPLGAATIAYCRGDRTAPLDPAHRHPAGAGARARGRSRVLHISDLHMLPGQRSKQRWVAALDELEPDLVVNTGDNLAHQQAVPVGAARRWARCWTGPACSSSAATTTTRPKPKNPVRYLTKSRKRIHGIPLPWQDLRAAFVEHGWLDLTHVRARLHGRRPADRRGRRRRPAPAPRPLRRDRGPPDPGAALRLGVTHSPGAPGAGRVRRTTVTTWSWRATPTAASSGSPATARSSPTATWTAPAPAVRPAGAPTRGCTCRRAWARRPTPRSGSRAHRKPAC